MPTMSAEDLGAFVERELDVEVTLIGTGADRESVLAPHGLAALTSAA